MAEPPRFDPYALIAVLEGQRVAYAVIGAFGRVVRGADEITHGVDIAPALRGENLSRLGLALEDLQGRRADGQPLARNEAEIRDEPVIVVETSAGELKLVPEPAGTRGYDDLRRAATREPIGKGLRPSIASTDDLARMLAALGREADKPKLRALRRLAELERSPGLDLGR